MNKKVIGILLFVLFIILSTKVYAHDVDTADIVESIDMQIEIDYDGSAKISENWIAHSSSRNAFIKYYKGVKKSDITDLEIIDEQGTVYDILPRFDSSISLVNKCGIVETSDGSEIYWGTVDGPHQYRINYKVKNFVRYLGENVKKGNLLDFVDRDVLTTNYIVIKANGYSFTSDNTKITGFDEALTKIQFQEDGSIYLEFNPYDFTDRELITFDIRSPFKTDKKFFLGLMQKQDYLVFWIIVIVAILYLILDCYRMIYEYRRNAKKIENIM